MKLVRITVIVVAVLLLVLVLALWLGPARLESGMNTVISHPAHEVSAEARELHKSLVIGDLHADSTLWQRDLLERSDRGHVDIPRMREGNVAVQMFTSVTKSPSGLNYEKNASDARDNITSLALLQAWPPATWNSLTERALYQAGRLHAMAEQAPGEFQLILSARDLEALLSRRGAGEAVVGEHHVALGSDYDGSISAPFDTSELVVLTDEMLKAGFTEVQIRKVMGENMMRFLRDNLPAD
jgi:microsomal dipeptidase-like Zn-dependent dipeptidase